VRRPLAFLVDDGVVHSLEVQPRAAGGLVVAVSRINAPFSLHEEPEFLFPLPLLGQVGSEPGKLFWLREILLQVAVLDEVCGILKQAKFLGAEFVGFALVDARCLHDFLQIFLEVYFFYVLELSVFLF